jgi:hypothetical protein
MSLSISRTRFPLSAKVEARLMEVVDLPSPGTLDVTTRTRAGAVASTNDRFVWTRR